MMSTLPVPLHCATVSLVLDYICPPSLLSPLPPHLVSPALAQRHHFLSIAPDDPVQYLSWPSDADPHTQQLAIRLLESFHKPTDHHVYYVRYTGDHDSTFAHVAIDLHDPPALRLVFQWHSPDGWKFHNLALMPFPEASYESVNNTTISQLQDFPCEPLLAVDNDERDSYWDAYGLSDDLTDQSLHETSRPDLDTVAEDAYWAQYSTVHGSGDSTLPTPPTINQKLAKERIIIAYPSYPTSSTYNPLEPPSPNTLAYRLANLSPRATSPPFVDDSDSASGSGSVSLTSPLPTNSSLPSSSANPSSDISPSISPRTQKAHYISRESQSHDALRDAIRGVYRLWKAGRLISSPTHAQLDDCEEFLDAVRQVIAESSL